MLLGFGRGLTMARSRTTLYEIPPSAGAQTTHLGMYMYCNAPKQEPSTWLACSKPNQASSRLWDTAIQLSNHANEQPRWCQPPSTVGMAVNASCRVDRSEEGRLQSIPSMISAWPWLAGSGQILEGLHKPSSRGAIGQATVWLGKQAKGRAWTPLSGFGSFG